MKNIFSPEAVQEIKQEYTKLIHRKSQNMTLAILAEDYYCSPSTIRDVVFDYPYREKKRAKRCKTGRTVPGPEPLLSEMNKANIRELRQQGRTLQYIADKYIVSIPTVYKALNEGYFKGDRKAKVS